jgi:iron complex outermembrane receptor protein
MKDTSHVDWHKAISRHLGATAPSRRQPLASLTGALALAAMALAPTLSVATPVAGGKPDSKDTQAVSAANFGALQPIIVTARFKSENLQDSPLAMTVLTANALQDRGITNITGIARSVPNMTLLPAGAGYGKSAVAYIRGVGQDDFNFAFEPGVGIYVDGIYYSTLFGSDFTLGDVARIEVLRGPQGTLFGRNSEGGAILIYDVQPGPKRDAYVQVGYGSYGRQMIRAASNATLIPGKLYMRVFGAAERANGYVNVLDYACKNPGLSGNLKPTTYSNNCKTGTEGSTNTIMGRVAFRWLVNDHLTVNLSADMERDGGSAAPDVPLLIDPSYSGAGTADYNTYVAVPYYGIPISSRFLTGSMYSTYSTFTDQRSGISIPNVNTMNAAGIQSRITWRAPDNVRVVSLTGYRNNSGQFSDNKGGPIPIELVYNHVKHHQFSEELRASGKALDHKLDWTVGGFYFKGYSWNGGEVDVPGAQILPPGLSPAFPDGTYGINFQLNDPVHSMNISGFVHGIYSFTRKLSLEVGARYSYDTKTYTFYRRLLPLTPPNPIFPAGTFLFPITSEGSSSHRVDPKVSLQYQWTPSFMTYATYATGYKAGGINPRPAAASQIVPFRPEWLQDYEVGIKSQWFHNRLRANLTAFVNNYHQMQVIGITSASSGVATSLVMNAASAKITGFEFQGEAEPMNRLLFNLSFGYLHFKYLSLGGAAYNPATNPSGITMGDVPPYVPKFKVNMGAQYTFNLGDFGTLTPRADWTYQSRIYFDVQNSDLASQAGYGLLNLGLTYGTYDGNWTASLQVHNATDKHYYLTMFNLLSSYGTLYGQPAMPRTLFFTIKRTF